MVLYRRLYGAQPPAGEVSLAYYAAEGASEDGRPHAIAGLRALNDRFPDDPRYRRALGSLLVLSVRTRSEGQKLLAGSGAHKGTVLLAGTSTPPPMPGHASKLPLSAEPRSTLNGSAAVPASATASATNSSTSTPPPAATVGSAAAAMSAGAAAQTPVQEQFAEAAASSAKPAQAQEARPTEVAGTPPPAQPLSLPASLPAGPTPPASPAPAEVATVPEPKASNAASASAQAPSPSAVSARSASPASATIPSRAAGSLADVELERAGFAALNAGRLHEAEGKFKVLLARNGENPRASGGLGLVRVRQANWNEAIPLLERAQLDQPTNPAIARSLRQARAAVGAPASAEPRVLQSTATRAASASASASHLIASRAAAEPHSLTALALARRPSASVAEPPNERSSAPGPGSDGKLSRAATLASAGEDRSAAALFREVTIADARQASAWVGLITSLQRLDADAEVLSAVERMPRETLQATLQVPGSAVALADVDARGGRTEAARQVLEGLLAQAPQPPGRSYAVAQSRLAELLLRENQPAQAYRLYRASLGSAPDNLQAWAGLLASLHATGHDREALDQLGTLSPALRVQLESNPLFLETAPLLYAGVNDNTNALAYWARLQQFAETEHTPVPATLSLQQAAWLGRVGDERHLYETLMSLGKRSDLSDNQRRAVQAVWAEWAVRQATEQARMGNSARAAVILNAAAAAFADNTSLRRTLALGFATANLPRNAVAMLRTEDMSNATAEELRTAVAAALAIHDEKQAELWLRPALVHYPADPDLLLLASRFETDSGHKKESAAYYQAALAAAAAHQRTLAAIADPQPKPAGPITPSPSGSSPDLATILAKAKAPGAKPTPAFER